MSTLHRPTGRGGADLGPTPARVERTALLGPVVTGLAPVTLLGALLYHPRLEDLRDKGEVAAALSADTVRWGLVHVAVGIAAGLVLIAFLEVDRFLRRTGDSRASAAGVPFVVVGSILFVFLPAFEIAMLAVESTGGDVEAVLVEADVWFLSLLVAGAACFAVGTALFAGSVIRNEHVGRRATWVIALALVVAGLARFVPLGVGLIVGASALVLGLGTLAVVMARQATSSRG